MLTASDMPSWMLVLAGIIPSRGETTEKARMVLRGQYVYSLEDLQRVYAVNPIREMEKVETPICFILGGKDCAQYFDNLKQAAEFKKNCLTIRENLEI